MKNFTKIPNEIIKNNKISDGAFRTYSLLKSYKYGSGNVFPSINTLAKLRGRTKKTIITHHQGLRLLGLISYKKRGFSASNQYFFNSEENYTNGENISKKNYTSKLKKTSPLSSQKLHPNNTEINNIKINKDIGDKKLPARTMGIYEKYPFLKEKRDRLLKKVTL